MSWRIVVIENQAKLDYKMGYMVVRGLETKRVLLDEIGILLIENPAVSLTGILIEALTEKKIKVIFCDRKRNPVAELMPHHGCHDSAAKIRTQIVWEQNIKDIIWRDIVSEKIRKQSEFLMEIGKIQQAGMLSEYVKQVELADSTNREGHAAKVYFNALFGMDFTRSADIPAKHIELITRFVPFDMNQKNLITKMTTRMQNIAIDESHYLETKEMLGKWEQYLMKLSLDACTRQKYDFSDEEHLTW